MTDILQTPRLQLQPFSPQDRPALAALLQEPAVRQTYMIPDFPDAAALERMVDAFFRLSGDGSRFVRGIYLQSQLIGFINDVEIAGGCIELGYVIHPAHWNRGYCTEMLTAVIPALLARGFRAVRTGAFAENAASIRVMEKCGMARLPETDTVAYRGREHTCVYYRFPAAN